MPPRKRTAAAPRAPGRRPRARSTKVDAALSASVLAHLEGVAVEALERMRADDLETQRHALHALDALLAGAGRVFKAGLVVDVLRRFVEERRQVLRALQIERAQVMSVPFFARFLEAQRDEERRQHSAEPAAPVVTKQKARGRTRRRRART